MATKGDVSGLDVLMFGGEPLIPMLSGLRTSRRSGVVQSESSGGMVRQRKKYYGNSYVAEATFMLKNLMVQDYMKSFSRKNEGKKFICYLRADRPLIEPYVVQVTSEWPDQLVSKKSASVTVTLEIDSVNCSNLDDILMALYQCLGNDTAEVLELANDGVLSLPYPGV
ncbi:hypothetical protein MW334_003527 [Vibrio parahaemolyticus]|nr:hypothetical protein [Vibrio parahaemolyticus]EJB8408340.1 hypothetical protein [Vibrio parahaemolyticus]ELA9712802.1 hypothetical protein [Vibrio parahaemolyticus]ELA9726310.1 hypothetical protein [Vibrio parahaemolyticus]